MSAAKVGRVFVKASLLLSYVDNCHVIVSNGATPYVSLLISCVLCACVAKSPLSYQENMYLIYVTHTCCSIHI